MTSLRYRLRAGYTAGVLLALFNGAYADEAPDFRRDVRPILLNHCGRCHGADSGSREAGLRLDTREGAIQAADSGAIPITPGDPNASELVRRIDAVDDELVMPPPRAKNPLTPAQRDVLRRWIAAGAPYTQHWAFVAPERPALPQVRQADWPRNPIDHFILERLEAQGLQPSPEADRTTWLRRVTLDLTGLPPSPEELDAFATNDSPAAYENAVERLLNSPRYAERMAMHWLDIARYADTNGYNNDEPRTMWPWRDWVIDSFKRGMTYDQFVTEQLAGDLLPNATLAQRVATGFNRNHVLTTEGGIIEEEYRVEYVADRVHTTATTFLASSMQCARCHDHKYDPISQRDYYSFSAFFANVPDGIVSYSQNKLPEPVVAVPSAEQSAQLAVLEKRRHSLEQARDERAAHAAAAAIDWEKSLSPERIAAFTPAGLIAHKSFDEPTAADAPSIGQRGDDSAAAAVQNSTIRKPGKIGAAQWFDGQAGIELENVTAPAKAISLSVWVQARPGTAMAVVSKMDDAEAFRGFDIILEDGKVASHFVHHWPDNGIKVITKQALSAHAWHHIAVCYDGEQHAAGVGIYVDGQRQETDAILDKLTETIQTNEPVRIGQRKNSAHFEGLIDDLQIYDSLLSSNQVTQLSSGEDLLGLRLSLSTAAAERTDLQRTQLAQYYLTQVDPQWRQLQTDLANLEKQVEEIKRAMPRVMVMQEMTPPRSTFVLNRGQYDQPREEVTADVPASLSVFPAGAPRNRLGLARWLVDPRHPLTARVAVNRWWEIFFGRGLVETSADFGLQGSLPTHPELLDWLATELVGTGWNQQEILKQIVLSATYRQSSRTSAARLAADPANRLLGRGPRGRLQAEVIRDGALAASGLLHEHVGGPSVKPYQPEGLWEDVSVERREKYQVDQGAGLYRRSMYTFWKRTCPPPAMASFDAPDRETCVVHRESTNTPLQALNLLNDPTYVEASRKLAELAMRHTADPSALVTFAFRRVLSRAPQSEETQLLVAAHAQALARFRHDAAGAEGLLSVGMAPRDAGLDEADLAAWTVVMSMILNLDEAISKT